jgi:hypothetical protein
MISTLFEDLEVPTKKCNQCLVEKPLALFSNNSGASHLRSKCRHCESLQRRQRSQYKSLRPPTNHVCPICDRNEDQCRGKGGSRSGTWCLDHNHKTGEFRGWLCHDCNRALGNFKDDTDLLEKALNYLKSTQTSLSKELD